MKILLTIVSLFAFMNSAISAETVGEKVDAKTNNVKRAVKHVANKGEEIVCDKTSKNCFAKKVDHKAGEVAEYTKDKAKEGKNIVDNDSKAKK